MEHDKYGLREYQLMLLDILVDFDKLCRENNIKYSLCAGTLLGAIRHKGFIPWDDDIDIMVDRENYNKLLLILNNNFSDKYSFIHDFWVPKIVKNIDDENCNTNLFIDIFVFDNMPNNKFLSGLKLLLIDILQGMMKTELNSKISLLWRIISYILFLFGKLFSKRYMQKMYNNISQWGNKKNTKYIKTYNSLFRIVNNEKHLSDIFDEITYADFEGLKFPIISKWDNFLKESYGDYMLPPPEDKRIPIHIASK